MENYSQVNTLSDEYIYYNLNLLHQEDNNGVLETQPIKCQFKEERLQPILEKASDYKMAVVRMDAPGFGLRKGLWAPNYYYVTLVDVDTGIEEQQVVNLDQVQFAPTQFSPTTAIYYYNQGVKMINDAFSAAFTALVAAVPGYAADAARPQQPPRLIFNEETQLFEFIIDQRHKDVNPKRVEIYWNFPIDRLIASFYIDFFGFNRPDRKDVRLRVIDEIQNRYLQTIGPDPFAGDPAAVDERYFLRIPQEFVTTNLWYDIYKIVLVSQTLNIRYEFTTTTNTDTNGQGQEVKKPIVTDFNYELGTDRQVFSRVTYIPQGELRYIDLMNDLPLKKIDFQLFYETNTGALEPWFLEPGTNWNLKVEFRKKY